MKKLLAVAAMAVLLCLTGLALSSEAQAQRCVDNGNGTVTDNGTGLMWQYATDGPMTWDAAMAHAATRTLGGHSGWRLPSIDELRSLLISPCMEMMSISQAGNWASTPHPHNSNFAWTLSLSTSGAGYARKSESYQARAVRSAP